MPIVIRENIPSWWCQAPALCDFPYDADWATQQVWNEKAINAHGRIMCEGNNGLCWGNLIPFNGFGCSEVDGTGYPNGLWTYFQDIYETVQHIEMTQSVNMWCIQANVKLFKFGAFNSNTNANNYFKYIDFLLRETDNTGAIVGEQVLMRVMGDALPNGVSQEPGAILIPFMQAKDVRATGQIASGFSYPGNGMSIQFVTRIRHEFRSASGLQNVTDRLTFSRNTSVVQSLGTDYFAGILNFQLKMYQECQ